MVHHHLQKSSTLHYLVMILTSEHVMVLVLMVMNVLGEYLQS